MDQSVEVKSPAPQPQLEPEPEPQQSHADSCFVGDESVDVDIGKGSFKQHDLSATTILLESSPSRVECVATSSENLDHTVYIFKVFTPDGREWYAQIPMPPLSAAACFAFRWSGSAHCRTHGCVSPMTGCARVISRRFSDFDKLRAELLKVRPSDQRMTHSSIANGASTLSATIHTSPIHTCLPWVGHRMAIQVSRASLSHASHGTRSVLPLNLSSSKEKSNFRYCHTPQRVLSCMQQHLSCMLPGVVLTWAVSMPVIEKLRLCVLFVLAAMDERNDRNVSRSEGSGDVPCR